MRDIEVAAAFDVTAAGQLALADVADELGVTVVLLGTPAEESGGGKVLLLKAGTFDDIAATCIREAGATPSFHSTKLASGSCGPHAVWSARRVASAIASRSWKGGRWRRCCVCRHDSSATQSPSSNIHASSRWTRSPSGAVRASRSSFQPAFLRIVAPAIAAGAAVVGFALVRLVKAGLDRDDGGSKRGSKG